MTVRTKTIEPKQMDEELVLYCVTGDIKKKRKDVYIYILCPENCIVSPFLCALFTLF